MYKKVQTTGKLIPLDSKEIQAQLPGAINVNRILGFRHSVTEPSHYFDSGNIDQIMDIYGENLMLLTVGVARRLIGKTMYFFHSKRKPSSSAYRMQFLQQGKLISMDKNRLVFEISMTHFKKRLTEIVEHTAFIDGDYVFFDNDYYPIYVFASNSGTVNQYTPSTSSDLSDFTDHLISDILYYCELPFDKASQSIRAMALNQNLSDFLLDQIDLIIARDGIVYSGSSDAKISNMIQSIIKFLVLYRRSQKQ